MYTNPKRKAKSAETILKPIYFSWLQLSDIESAIRFIVNNLTLELDYSQVFPNAAKKMSRSEVEIFPSLSKSPGQLLPPSGHTTEATPAA